MNFYLLYNRNKDQNYIILYQNFEAKYYKQIGKLIKRFPKIDSYEKANKNKRPLLK